MPQNTQNNQKGTSPSKLIQRGVDNSWGQQGKGTTSPDKALADKFTRHPVDIPKKNG